MARLREEGRELGAVGTGCSTRYTYVCTHSAAAGAVTLIAVFSNSREQLLPWSSGSVGMESSEPSARSIASWTKARTYIRKERGCREGEGGEGGRERYRGLGAHHSRINPQHLG